MVHVITHENYIDVFGGERRDEVGNMAEAALRRAQANKEIWKYNAFLEREAVLLTFRYFVHASMKEMTALS